MNSVAFYLGSRAIYMNSLIIAAGIIICSVISCVLYKRRTGNLSAMAVFLPLSYILGALIGRLMHWYFTGSAYSGGFIQAMTDFSVGSFALMGVIAGPWIAAGIVKLLNLTRSAGRVLDCAAPGLCLVIAAVKLGAWFTSSNRGRTIKVEFLHFLPVSVASTDAAGNVTYKFATFFIATILMIAAFFFVKMLYDDYSRAKMFAPCSKFGNVWRMFLVISGLVEIVMDSTRTDSLLMHFRFIHKLNAYSAFISLGQVFSLAVIIYVFVYYLVCAIRINGFSPRHILDIVLFLVSVVGIGYLGEYDLQRHGGVYLGNTAIVNGILACYGVMIVSCVILALVIHAVFKSCVYVEDTGYEY